MYPSHASLVGNTNARDKPSFVLAIAYATSTHKDFVFPSLASAARQSGHASVFAVLCTAHISHEEAARQGTRTTLPVQTGKPRSCGADERSH